MMPDHKGERSWKGAKRLRGRAYYRRVVEEKAARDAEQRRAAVNRFVKQRSMLVSASRYQSSDDATVRERQHIVTREIVSVVTDMMRVTESDGLRWAGSVTDLLEMVKVAYVDGSIVRDDGSPMTFTEMVRHVFPAFRLKPVSNPHARVQRAESRKGVRQLTMQERLMHLMFDCESADAIEIFWHSMIVCE